ncbi:rhodanese-like domain-containing protein [Candidatus Venteria ishoeyi]|uniref:Molybdopterin biosynthesis protein MoeB n=1 Tax=Candidatus Venteria ishoeyi TaxID=1899563 RepID=A0A1H6FA20_9GAMM|nr:rhodanese-like domain-containing protein [Candidatus Venteria ishoeyi]MDM8547620.1 rhodanese-like domain-containing protein [Candidatus Venteria ishoeyi]SEH06149.1 molybdopterin biosynthesis protein MoeB [Candidatus Venteria ishoeyi]
MIRLTVLFMAFFLSFSAYAEVKHIDNTALKQLLKKNIPIIDIRRSEEWRQTGIVPDSHLLTFFDKKGSYDTPKWLTELDKIAKKDQPFILICRTGNRTRTIANFLDKRVGYQQIYNVERGISNWIKQKQPVVMPELKK